MTQTNFAAGQIPTDATVATATSSLFTKDVSYPAGETLSAGNVVFIEPAPTTAQATSAQNVGDVTANTRVSFPVFGSGSAASTMKLNLAKTGSPSVNLGVRIETDNAGSPSGTLVNANATGTVAAASVPVVYGELSENAPAKTGGSTLVNTPQGYRISTNTLPVVLKTVTQDGICTATRAILKNAGGTTLATATFSGAVATFNYNLSPSTQYRIECDNNGSNYARRNDAGGFPLNNTHINYLQGSISGADDSLGYTIVSIQTISNPVDTTVTLGGSFTIPAGQKCHIVTYQGTYGSETINASNYYRVGYYTNDSTTRGAKLRNATVYGSMLTTRVPYTSSTLFSSRVLSKTDADFTYKLDWHGISQEAVTAGDLATGKYPTIALEGIDSNQTGLTPPAPAKTTYYLSNTPGAIGSSAGTNSKKIGAALTDTKLQIYPIPL